MSRLRMTNLVALFLIGGLLLACGGKSKGTSDVDAIKSVTNDYVAKSAGGQGEQAYVLLASSVQAKCDKDKFSKQSENVANSLKQSNTKVSITSIDGISVNGNTADARVTFSTSPTQPVEYQYAKEGGKWRVAPVNMGC